MTPHSLTTKANIESGHRTGALFKKAFPRLHPSIDIEERKATRHLEDRRHTNILILDSYDRHEPIIVASRTV